MSEYKHWCGNCQIKIYMRRHYGWELTWQNCPYTCEYATAMRCSAETRGEEPEKETKTDHWGYEKEERPDFVEVTRCRDCEHWETAYDEDKAEHGLCYGHRFSVFVTPADGYCYKGERREQWSNISKAE